MNDNTYYHKEVKIPAVCVDAFVKLVTQEDYPGRIFDPTTIYLESAWGNSEVNIADMIKYGETDTVLHLDLDCGSLIYDAEKHQDCINGDDLSRIISLTKLADVKQEVNWTNGDTVLYDNGVFKPFNLTAAFAAIDSRFSQINELIEQLQDAINSINNRFDVLENKVDNFIAQTNNRLSVIERLLVKPEGIPEDSVIAWGNINDYGIDKTHGLYTHNPSAEITGDQWFK